MEFWARNAEPYIRECLEEGLSKFIFSRKFLDGRVIDVEKFIDLFLTPPIEYRVLIVDPAGTLELRRGDTLARPSAVYPTWDYNIDDIATLEELVETPVGSDWDACNDPRIPIEERPVYGQEHRVVITGLPPVGTGIGRRFTMTLRSLQEEYPAAILHVFGLSSFRVMFGFGFGAADYEPQETAKRKSVVLPNGKVIRFEDAQRWQKWFTLLGCSVADMGVPRKRTLYNIKSALWAVEHFRDDAPFVTRSRTYVVDPDVSTQIQPTGSRMSRGGPPATVGDKLLCDSCSLATRCKSFRQGEVCSLKGSETATLAKLFRSRDPDQIIDGLGSIMTVQTERLEQALEVEQEFGGKDGAALDGEVTRLANSIFDRGTKLAKLLDPARFGPKVAMNITGPGAPERSITPAEAVAGVVKELRAQGFADEQITPEMIDALLSNKPELEETLPVIEVTVDEETDDSEF